MPKAEATLGSAAPQTPPKAAACDSASLAPNPASKAMRITLLMQRPEGASLDEMVAETSWLPHTVRAALTGLRKKGHKIAKSKVDEVTRYTIAPASLS
ncbi:DUF3489 domain-containing protein [Croceibacterium sp. LX-88]|uniref:DUF3489 domain-containing protein n=2 Tax=Croceibacterium selenioxidans TaxID=2838833 RepID=A0ABS5W4L0_9SPHN|nr:DUF3489 domain-containing protein [Croceibacterium selenioxidans]